MQLLDVRQRLHTCQQLHEVSRTSIGGGITNVKGTTNSRSTTVMENGPRTFTQTSSCFRETSAISESSVVSKSTSSNGYATHLRRARKISSTSRAGNSTNISGSTYSRLHDRRLQEEFHERQRHHKDGERHQHPQEEEQLHQGELHQNRFQRPHRRYHWEGHHAMGHHLHHRQHVGPRQAARETRNWQRCTTKQNTDALCQPQRYAPAAARGHSTRQEEEQEQMQQAEGHHAEPPR
ncbi:unnamed protein product [Prorocentrum cordatum]|uniref:Uncharacterized protein n=1 Tax=Prorocentrum cordatum TaxID=2364126 RepID=A0ABN9VQC4_9DINO|nr:unnamed protein product [Polarella glacialis]